MEQEEFMDIDGPEFLESINSDIVHYRNVANYGSISRLRDNETDSRRSREKSLFCTQVAVLDTNFLISNLAYVKKLVNQAQSYPGRLVLVVPWTVVHELDGLKKGFNYGDDAVGKTKTAYLAQTAMWFLESVLRDKCPSLRGQKSWELHDKDAKHVRGDDSILDCCLFFQNLGLLHVTLLSNDRNLSIKAMVHEIDSISAETKDRKDFYLESIPRMVPYSGPFPHLSPTLSTVANPANSAGEEYQTMETEPTEVVNWFDEDIEMASDKPAPAPAPVPKTEKKVVLGLSASVYAPGNHEKLRARRLKNKSLGSSA